MELIFYTAQQVSAMTSLGVTWLWKQCREGKIPHHKLGGRYRWTDDDLAALTAQTAVAPKATEHRA
jgi:predicted DNA-binding transcriptional regulator AlpA